MQTLTVISQFWQLQNFMHVHDCFEINYIFKGECELVFLDEKRILKEGDFCITVTLYQAFNQTA